MKKNLFVATLASLAMLTSCGGSAAKTVGVYQQEHIANLTANADAGTSDNISWVYNLKLLDDKSYELIYGYTFAVNGMGINYGRNVFSEGKYAITAEDADLGTKTISLEMPTAVLVTVTHRNATKAIIDSQNWPNIDADEDGTPDPVEYVLMERAETESWSNAADFIAAYGRTYTMAVNTTGEITDVTITSHDGKQIEQLNAVKKVEA